MAKMNSTNLYITTNILVLNAKSDDPKSWQDLYRLLPYLRNSLCCVVCGNLLVDPLTPTSKCNHHLCRRCKDGRKKIKPACMWCKDNSAYVSNRSLRVMLQCYNKMCILLSKSFIFKELTKLADQQSGTGTSEGAENLISFIKEGEAFYDAYESAGGLPKSAYSILPCVYTNSSTQTLTTQTTISHPEPKTTISNISSNTTTNTTTKSKPYLYSVLYPGAGNKMTIKRKVKDPLEVTSKSANKEPQNEKSIFKKPTTKCNVKPKRGCRCGNATATPGKLTCCGQRCPCYVDSKACVECKCRGCRNPHRPDGNKVRPLIPEIQRIPYVSQQSQQQPQQQSQQQQSQVHPCKTEKSENNLQKVVQLDNVCTIEPIGQRYTKTYKVVTGNYNGLSVATNILLNGPLLTGDEDELTVV